MAAHSWLIASLAGTRFRGACQPRHMINDARPPTHKHLISFISPRAPCSGVIAGDMQCDT